jgi:hypothetical protein
MVKDKLAESIGNGKYNIANKKAPPPRGGAYPGYEKAKRLFAFQGVLDAANGTLGLAGGPVGRALSFHLGVASNFTGCLLDGALDLIGCTFDAIFIHRPNSFALAE